jgi:hypothetical protein
MIQFINDSNYTLIISQSNYFELLSAHEKES